jgi:hypothetical protein
MYTLDQHLVRGHRYDLLRDACQHRRPVRRATARTLFRLARTA